MGGTRHAAHPVDVLDAAYRVGGDETSWLDGVVTAARPQLDEGRGVVAYVFSRDEDERVRLDAPVGRGASLATMTTLVSALRLAPADVLERAHYGSAARATLSDVVGARSLAADALVRAFGAVSGVGDFRAIKASGVDQAGVVLGVPLPRQARGADGTPASWVRVAVHLTTMLRLRRAGVDAQGLPARMAAIVDPRRGVVHAQGDARDERVALREACTRLDRARASASRDAEAALQIWTGLVDARWSIVDHVESDGRRLLVVCRNELDVAAPRALTEREKQVVAHTAVGHSHKLIGYELGISASTARTLERRAMEKLGARSRLELVRVLSLARAAAQRDAIAGSA